jgi:hypothetical protein
MVPEEPEDRFADLGPRRPEGDAGGEGRGDRRSAAERFAELDEREPEPQPARRPETPRPAGRYTWVVGIAFVLALIVAGANALRHAGQGDRGIQAGKHLPVFAAPLVTSGHDKDVNFHVKRQGGVPAACDVHLPGVVNLCQLRRKPLVITFIANGSGSCAAQFERVNAVARAFPQVNFLGVISKTSLGEAAKIARSRHAAFPIAFDRRADLFNLYAIGDCPTTVFSHAGGISAGTRNSSLSVAQLRRYVRALLRSPHRALPL